MKSRYVVEPVPLARRIRNALIAAGGAGSIAVLIGSYEAASGVLRDYWFCPAAVAALGAICAWRALTEKASPERSVPPMKERAGFPEGGGDRKNQASAIRS